MVVDIRGTHGSGKSWIVHQLLERFKHEPIMGQCTSEEGHLGYHLIQPDVGVVGKYSTKCGGCDGVRTADEVCARIRLLYEQYRVVVLEGILVSHTFKRYHELAEELGDYHFCFLNTPERTCVARTRARRLAAGNTKPFNPKNLKHDHHQIWTNVRGKMKAAGHNVHVIDHRNPLPQILELLDCKEPKS